MTDTMTDDRLFVAEQTSDSRSADNDGEALIDEILLLEEISIDGMCGVY